MIRPETLLVDRQSLAVQRLRLGVSSLSLKQAAKLVHQPGSRCCNSSGIGILRNSLRMGCQGIE
jgi:hypothetical protein